MSTPLEHDYIGLSEMSDTSTLSSVESLKLNLKETELRLGLPGSASPERNKGSGNGSGLLSLSLKRGFSDAIIDGAGGKWGGDLSKGVFSPRSGGNAGVVVVGESVGVKEAVQQQSVGTPNSKAKGVTEKKVQNLESGGSDLAPPAKAQVVGWPPIRSFRKNTMASIPAKNADDAEGKSGAGCLYVKVSMDGAPYLRKVDLKTYSNYMELSSALMKMFGQCASQGIQGREGPSEIRLMDLIHGSEYVLTYEDKDEDWMLVGDVPWEMFTDSCKRLRIMKGSDAIGLAPRSMEKSKNRT